MAMALNEAGYPTRFNPVSWDFQRENELEFLDRRPPDAVILKAAELAGIADLLDEDLVRERRIADEPARMFRWQRD